MDLLGIDVGRHKGRGGYGSNKRIFVDRYVGDGGTKPRNGSDRYENQNNVKLIGQRWEGDIMVHEVVKYECL